MPRLRAAALMRWIHSARKSRLRTLRERYMCNHACWTLSFATAWQFFRLPRKPFAHFRTRLRRRRALNPLLARGMTVLYYLGVRKQYVDLMMMRGRHVARVAELALALLAPVREQVALEDTLELELPRRGLLEPLLGAGMGLDLGHDARSGFMPHTPAQDKGFVQIRWNRTDEADPGKSWT